MLAACPRYPEAWRLQLVAIDPDLRTKLLPGIRHDLELGSDGQELTRARV